MVAATEVGGCAPSEAAATAATAATAAATAAAAISRRLGAVVAGRLLTGEEAAEDAPLREAASFSTTALGGSRTLKLRSPVCRVSCVVEREKDPRQAL